MEQGKQTAIRTARKRIAEARKQEMAYLMLNGLGLHEIPAKITELDKITSLSISDNRIRNLGPARELSGIDHLVLSGNPVFGALGELASFPKLKNLFLGGCQLTSLRDLPLLPKLEKIELADNRIQDLSPLSRLPSLKRVVLTDNAVSSLRPLRGLLERGVEIYGRWSLAYSLANEYVYFKGNPLIDPPYAIAREGAQAVLRYWAVKDGATTPKPATPAGRPDRKGHHPAPASAPNPSDNLRLLRVASAAKKCVREDCLRAAIDQLSAHLPRPELLDARLRELETEVMEGTISHEAASLRRAQLRKAILVAAEQLR